MTAIRTPSPYREEQGVALIEMRLDTLQQLFNSLDPSPFHSKDLDADAEEWIVGAYRELPAAKPARLLIWLPATEIALREAAQVRSAINAYFAYRAEAAGRDLRQQFSIGRTSLAIGVGFLVGCILARQLVHSLGASPGHNLIAEGLLILGWVAMWRPLEIYLYDWWPVRRRQRILQRLSQIEVELRAEVGQAAPLASLRTTD